jgi:hypothetical protein
MLNVYYLYKATTIKQIPQSDSTLNEEKELLIKDELLIKSINKLNERIEKLESKITMLDSTITTSQYDILQ